MSSTLKLKLSTCARLLGRIALLITALLGLAGNGYGAGIFDAGATAPTPGANDISQLIGGFDNGGSYYVDHTPPPGQTFTTGSNSLGYLLKNLYFKNKSGTIGSQAYTLRIYSLTNAATGTATLLTTYVSTNSLANFSGDWIEWTSLTNILNPGTNYGFSIARNGSGFWEVDSATGNLYAGGVAAGFPTAGGAISIYTAAADAAFDLNLVAITDPLVGDTQFSPTNSVFAGPTVTLSATFSGTAPFTSFIWQSDGGTSGVTWTNLPGSTTNTYSLNTTGLGTGTYQYRLAVTGGAGTVTNNPGSLVILPPTAPIVAAQTVISPSNTFAGNVVTMSASFTGLAPISYQWQFSDLATFTNNISGATNNTFILSDPVVSNTGSYLLVASNSLGSSNSAFTALTVTNSSAGVQILNLGATTPVSSGFDIAQLSSVGNQKFPSGGLNYYSDNGAGAACGQTFTTGANPDGYLLSSLYIQWGNIEGSHPAANPYTLCIYSVSGTAVTLIQTYTNQNSAAAMATGNWTKWIGLSNILAPNAVYAYSIRARDVNGNGSGFMQVMNSDPNPYPGGQLGLFPSATGTANFGNSGDDATFLIHLASAPASAPVVQSVSIAPANSVANPIYVGTPVTLSAVAIGSLPAYQWLSNNGTGGTTFTPISGATSNPYVLDTSSLSPSTQYQYEVIVTNSAGSATSSSVLLNLTNASGPILLTGTTYTPSGVVIVGNSVQMSASFIGSQPITYQWTADTGSGFTNIPGATSNTFTISSTQFADSGKYSLVASSRPPGIGLTSTSSASNALYVVSAPDTNTTAAKISDGGTSPFLGAYDVSQLTDASTPPTGLNYYVDNASPPGEIFTTGSTLPAGYTGLPLNYVYFKHDPTGGGTGYATAQAYTLFVYKMLDSSNAQLLTTYVTTNTTSFASGDWVRVDGLTNILQTNSLYAFALHRNTSGFWRVACNVSLSPFPDGQAALLPPQGGAALTSSPDTNGVYYDGAYVAGMTPASAPVELAAMTINPSTIHTGQGPVVMTASFVGSLPITYQWQANTGTGFTNIPGATATTYTIPVATVALQGSYVCLASNNNSLGTPTPSTAQNLTVDPTVQTGLINPTTRNGSFELVSGVEGTGKVNFSTGTVDNWTTWPAFPNSGDTGADISGAATDGTRDAFLQGDSGIYNIAGQIITAGDTYIYSWDWVLAGRGAATVQLGYWNGSSVVLIPGTDSSAPGGTAAILGLGTNYTVLPGDPAIGNPVVLTVNAPSSANYPEVDNFVLDVFPAGSIAANPTNITFSVNGTSAALSWPADHLGWILQSQTNSVSVGLGNNWVDVPGTGSVTSKNIPINTNLVSVYFRLRHP